MLNVDISLASRVGAHIPAEWASRTVLDASVVRDLMTKQPVIVFRQQQMEPADLLAFARQLGRPITHSAEKKVLRNRHPVHREISFINTERQAGINWEVTLKRATSWHTDHVWATTPCSTGILYAVDVGEDEPGTLFADTAAAYESLSSETKEAIRGLRVSYEYDAQSAGRSGDSGVTPARSSVSHPLVRTIPETGQKALYLTLQHTASVTGLDSGASKELIASLIEHCTRECFVYRHKWSCGDLVIWDQRRTLHRGEAASSPDRRRVLMRTILAGEVPE